MLIVFQVSWNYDPVKEILKIRCHINSTKFSKIMDRDKVLKEYSDETLSISGKKGIYEKLAISEMK